MQLIKRKKLRSTPSSNIFTFAQPNELRSVHLNEHKVVSQRERTGSRAEMSKREHLNDTTTSCGMKHLLSAVFSFCGGRANPFLPSLPYSLIKIKKKNLRKTILRIIYQLIVTLLQNEYENIYLQSCYQIITLSFNKKFVLMQ